MDENNQPQMITIDDMTFRVRVPEEPDTADRLLVLLHGHLGNENVMWILTKTIPKSYMMLSPRAPVRLGPDQYSWHAIEPQWPGLDHYQALSEDLLKRVDHWVEDHQITVKRYDIMGFSQGAVLAYALSILHPEKIGKVAALAGFLPRSWKETLANNDLQLGGKSFFIAHGIKDDIIPISEARKSAEWLSEKGAEVTFCEADIGHKLSADCFNGLGEFFG